MTLLSRRTALLGAAAFTVGASLRARPSLAQAPGPFVLPPLPYAYEANEPHIDAQTMTLHHTRHHAAFVANLNTLLKDHGQIAAMPPASILAKLAEMPETLRTPLRNNGGGHANHSMFWTVMGGKGGAPTGALAEAITRDLGGLEALQTSFNRAGLGQFGSGWVFVTADRAGKLTQSTRPNQDSPLMDSAMPIFGNEVWEHAYYLKYNNRRADYLTAWWNVLDWSKISARYEAAKAGTLAL